MCRTYESAKGKDRTYLIEHGQANPTTANLNVTKNGIELPLRTVTERNNLHSSNLNRQELIW